LEFMGREWDGADGFRRSLNPADVERDNPFGRTSRTSPEYRAGTLFQEWATAWATECLRVLKPGGHMLAFGGTRTWHRLACAVEDAGFEVRDSIAWLYGSGFPKSLDVSKAIDKAAGAEREVVGRYVPPNGKTWNLEADESVPGYSGGLGLRSESLNITAPATDAARTWQGWGTALKPAFEPIVVARKPLAGTVAVNVLAHGTGALNIDGCRVGDRGEVEYSVTRWKPGAERNRDGGTWKRQDVDAPTVAGVLPPGRWPANVVLDESQAAALDEQSGERRDGVAVNRNKDPEAEKPHEVYGGGWLNGDLPDRTFGGSGGASRFFYVAKADASERVRVNGTAHPTVKPLALMRWLVRLVTPPGGTVLEPFAGSGTTVEACILEGFQCVAIEREADYLPLIVQRINRRRDPVRAVKAAGEDGGLFDLLDEESA
jgi:site-specific DNA-methyltransferase (adenine-specific)